MFKVNNRNTRTWCKICSKLTIKTPERRHWCLEESFLDLAMMVIQENLNAAVFHFEFCCGMKNTSMVKSFVENVMLLQAWLGNLRLCSKVVSSNFRN